MTYTVQGNPSAFPPCGYCGASYEAHEEVLEYGDIRGHRINRPDQPQHGMYHSFSPMPPNAHGLREGDSNVGDTGNSSQWISVEDYLPSYGQLVIVNGIGVARYCAVLVNVDSLGVHFETVGHRHSSESIKLIPTHWMAIPELVTDSQTVSNWPSGWIDVKDTEPPKHTPLICCDKSGFMFVATYDGYGYQSNCTFNFVTHWMLAPSTPKPKREWGLIDILRTAIKTDSVINVNGYLARVSSVEVNTSDGVAGSVTVTMRENYDR